MLILFASCFASSSADAETWDYRLNDQVQFRMWLPDDQEVIWGIYLIFNESTGDTRVLAEREFIQRWARTMGFGIIGTQFSDGTTAPRALGRTHRSGRGSSGRPR